MRQVIRSWWLMVLTVLIAGLVPAVASAQDYDEDGDGGDACGALTHPRLAGQYPAGIPIRSVSEDPALVFQVQPANVPGVSGPAVHVMERRTGTYLQDLPPASGGAWSVPLAVRVESFRITHEGGHAASTEGTLFVYDAIVTPAQISPFAPPPHLYRFHYRYDAATHAFTSELIEDRVIPAAQFDASGPNPFTGVIYVESLALLPDGSVLLSDAVGGSIWYSDPTRTSWHMALIDLRFGVALGMPITGTGRAPGGGTRTYAFLPPAFPGMPPGLGMYPGLSGLTYATRTDEVCFSVVSYGGLFCIGRQALLDASIPVFAKTYPSDPQHLFGFARVLLAPPAFQPGVPISAAETNLIAAIDYNRFDPDSTQLYYQRAAADAFTGGYNVLNSIDLVTGATTVIARSQTHYDWASEVSAAPPLCLEEYPLVASGGHCRSAAHDVFSSVGQEENNADTNVLLGGVSTYVADTPQPFVRISLR